MAKLRIEQRKDEPPDIFAMRAFAMAMPLMDTYTLHAAACWITDVSMAKIKKEAATATKKGLPP